ncbi:MAG: enoyl-CoA hydratase/isomerase family protein [Propionivibrio sp.]|uniref:Enoyl-CoA hydratase/isomerase family protein n=1 Tax=Candidatus Propionivibrio dominans TaxID=2954373 RepID=A0A9D7FND2_9RHOO|nr:enoyl-CoA hydratase/isomerase family protein [Candidatus Propionivibrio dominans]
MSTPYIPTQFHNDSLFHGYKQFSNNFEPEDGVFRFAMQGQPIPSFSLALLEEIRNIQCRIEASGGMIAWQGELHRLNFIVLESNVAGVFNLGGDIALFRRLIEARDRFALSRYARLCIDAIHHSIVDYNLPCQTISLVAGKALGGGMESALSSNVVIAEKSAEFGLPEVLFNLFPGMGAWNLISRRVGSRLAEEIITSGRSYSGEELHRLGLVDVLADDGQGEQALRDYLRGAKRKQKTLNALARVREAMSPISHDDLARIIDIWVDSAMGLDARDLKMMERLVNAQSRAFSRPDVQAQASAGEQTRSASLPLAEVTE